MWGAEGGSVHTLWRIPPLRISGSPCICYRSVRGCGSAAPSSPAPRPPPLRIYRSMGAPAADLRADAAQQLLPVERLLHVVIGTAVQAHHDVVRVAVGRHHDDGDEVRLVPLAYLGAHLKMRVQRPRGSGSISGSICRSTCGSTYGSSCGSRSAPIAPGRRDDACLQENVWASFPIHTPHVRPPPSSSSSAHPTLPHTSYPFISGIMMSRRMTSGRMLLRLRNSRASTPHKACSTCREYRGEEGGDSPAFEFAYDSHLFTPYSIPPFLFKPVFHTPVVHTWYPSVLSRFSTTIWLIGSSSTLSTRKPSWVS